MRPVSKSGEYIFAWVNAIDELNYYELFGVENDAPADTLREAFHAFCDVFHPDLHLGRASDEREALSVIFKRATEAYLVLSDEALRGQYDRELAVHPRATPPPRISHSPRAGHTAHPGKVAKLEDVVRSPSSRPFARRAEELMRSGDYRQAKLQLVMANHLEPNNEALESALKDVEAKLVNK
jgi:DnaJ-class molecular chaperone